MTDIVIIGGGIIGMLTARELRMDGADVTLLDRRETGRESTWAGGGILSPLYPWRYDDAVTYLAGWGQAHYRSIVHELEENTGISPQWTANGLLVLDEEEHDSAIEWARRHQRSLELIDRDQVTELEPNLNCPTNQAIWMPDVAQVRNPRLARALRCDIEKRGVRILEHTPAEALIQDGDRVTGVQIGNGTIVADKILVCAGAWTAAQLLPTGLRLDIHPVRGQMILFKGKPGMLQRITLYKDRYTIPRRDGRILMGSTLEETGFEKATTTGARTELRCIAIERFPVLADCEIEYHWAGLRPSSPSGIPYIGPHPEVEGLFVNSGHFRNGVVLGAASCRLMADLILAKEPILDPSPYALTASRSPQLV